jgi:hypothetical protein
MRTLIPLIVLLTALSAPAPARTAQGMMGVSLEVVPPATVQVGGGVRTEAGRLSVPLTLQFAARPGVQVEPSAGGRCTVAVQGGGEPGDWRVRLHCPTREMRGVQVVRLLVTPAS